jgi:hypothetical protein
MQLYSYFVSQSAQTSGYALLHGLTTQDLHLSDSRDYLMHEIHQVIGLIYYLHMYEF